MSNHYKQEEALLQRALESIPKGSKPNYAAVARAFDCDYVKLRRRHQGMASKMTRPISYYRLTDAQDSALRAWIEFMDSCCLSPTRHMIENCANSILRQAASASPSNPPKVGQHWVRRYLKRHPEYHIRRQRSIDIERKRAHNPANIRMWFEKLQRVIMEHGI